MPPRIVSSSEHIKASLSAGVYTNKHGEARVYLVRVCFLFGQIRRAPLPPFAVESGSKHGHFLQIFRLGFGGLVELFGCICSFCLVYVKAIFAFSAKETSVKCF